MIVDREALVAKAQAERRLCQSVQVDLKGRIFVPGDETDAACVITDMSASGARVVCKELAPRPDAQVVLYIDGFGRFEALVVHQPDNEAAGAGFGVKFTCSPLKRERVADQLSAYMNHGVLDESTLRRHERTPARELTHFTRANGDVINCEVLDLSLSGLSLSTRRRPPIGEIVTIGQMSGRVVRHHETGIGVEFVRIPGAAADQRPARVAIR